MDVQREGDFIVFYARINGAPPENLSVEVYYLFEQDIGSDTDQVPPQTVRMEYNSSTGYWVAHVDKKYDASTLHYYLVVKDMGNGESIMADAGEYTYTTPLDFNQPWCIAGAIILFIAFELVMHHSKIREKMGKKRDEVEEEDSEEL